MSVNEAMYLAGITTTHGAIGDSDTSIMNRPANSIGVAQSLTGPLSGTGTNAKAGQAGPSAGRSALSTRNAQALPFVANEVLVVNPTPQAIQRAVALGFVAKSSENFDKLGIKIVHMATPAGSSSVDALHQLEANAPSMSALLNMHYRPIQAAAQADEGPGSSISQKGSGCSRERCYGPTLIAWDNNLTRCSQAVRVGVIDTGIDPQHPTFAHQPVQIGNLLQDQPPGPTTHGTGVLALLAGDPASATPGLIPNAEFYAADIFYSDANGAPVSDTAHLLRAFEWLEAFDVNVINLSLTGPKDDLIKDAVEKLAKKGVIIVAAVGNDGPGAPPAYPAAYPEVVAVTAVDRNLRAYRHANQGSYVDLAAPGVDIWTALPNGRGGVLTGTSLAAPFVTSIIATMYQSLKEKNKSAALHRIHYTALGSAGRNPIYGRGLAQAPTTCSPAPVDENPLVASVGGAPVIQASVNPLGLLALRNGPH